MKDTERLSDQLSSKLQSWTKHAQTLPYPTNNDKCVYSRIFSGFQLSQGGEKGGAARYFQGHPTTVFCKICVRRSKYCLEFFIT